MISRLINPHFGISAAFRWMIVPLLVITIALATMVTTQADRTRRHRQRHSGRQHLHSQRLRTQSLLKCLDEEVEEGDDSSKPQEGRLR